MRILILGGYGTFGSRLIRLLADAPDLRLIAAGRSLAKAEAFAASLPSQKAEVIAACVDRMGDLTEAITTLNPDMIVDASGPFQIYGDDPYRVVKAALEAGIDYVDLADGADFVAGIAAFDAQAKARGVTILSGASTYPALSSAVVRHLTEDWQRVEHIEMGLAPSPQAGLGLNVVKAILSYAGKPTPVTSGGQTTTEPALISSRRFTIAPGGVEPLPPLRYALVALPDQLLFPTIWPDLQTLWPGVGTRPQFLLRVLSLSARLVQWRVLRSLSPLSGLAFGAMKRMAWGAHRGGMIVRVGGRDANGEAATREWHMIAEGDDGPFIPAMAVAALIRRRMAGEALATGARPATHDVSLADYNTAFATKAITTGIRGAACETAPLYQRVLAEAWDDLPEPIRDMHTAPDGLRVSGTATVERGTNPLSRLIGAVVGFPKAGTSIPVEVTFTERDGGELWQRRFAGKPFSSFQKEGSGAFEHMISERFGPLEFGLALALKDGRLWLNTKGWRAFGIPMPRFLAPGGDAFEHAEDGRFHFHVEIKHWMTGLIVRYRGVLSRDEG